MLFQDSLSTEMVTFSISIDFDYAETQQVCGCKVWAVGKAQIQRKRSCSESLEPRHAASHPQLGTGNTHTGPF